jgi:hypothetical protein
MVSDVQDIDEGGAPDRICATCAHAESDHTLQEVEVGGNTLRRIYCEGCEEYHDFVPEPLDI